MKRALAWAVLPCLFFSACASAGRNLTKATSAESQRSLAAGDYEKALDGFKEAHEKDPGNRDLAANYRRTVEDIKRAADGARSRRDYARAGSIFRILHDRYGDFGEFAARLTFGKPQLATALRECSIAAVDDSVAKAMRAGSFAKAIEIFKAALKEYPADPELRAKYRAVVLRIKAAGDKAFAAKDYARAGTVNVLLLRNYPSFEGLQPAVAFHRESLTDVVSACRESLTKTGLAEYRSGDLAKAIKTWESLLAFDPDNAEIRKAVTTARTQLDALNKEK